MQAAASVYKTAARETLRRNRKCAEMVIIKNTEVSKTVISHAEDGARKLLLTDRSLSVSRKKVSVCMTMMRQCGLLALVKCI